MNDIAVLLSDARHRALLDALPVGIALLDSNQYILCCNTTFTDLLGLAAGRLASPAAVDAARRQKAADRLRVVVSTSNLAEGRSVLSAFDATGAADTATQASRPSYTTPAPPASTSVELTAVGRAIPSMGLAAFTADGAVLFSNGRLVELLGVSEATVRPGLGFAALLDEIASSVRFDTPEGAAFLAAQRAVDRLQPAASQYTDPAGRVIEVASDPIAGGGWTWTVADLRAWARADDDPQRRLRVLGSILAAIPHGVCVYDIDHRVTLFNPAYSKIMTGAPLQLGEHLVDIIRRRTAAGEYGDGPADEVSARQFAFDLSRPQARQRRRPNGTVIDVRTAPLPEGGHISVVTDITPLTHAEEEVRRRVEAMDLMMASTRHGILYWGGDRRLIASNDLAAELLGHPPGLLVPGRTTDEVLDDMIARNEWGDPQLTRQVVEAQRVRDHSVPYRRRLKTRAGRVLDARSEPAPGGCWISTFSDVTEMVRAEEELRHAKEAAEAASQAKSRFLATMSHELRTPLNSVIGFSDALVREGPQPAPARVAEFAQQINDAGRQLLGLINIILDVARIESGRFDLAVDRVDIGGLVRDALRQTAASAQAAGIGLADELPDELPVLRADERRLQQVLTHLLSNAVKFTDAGGTVTVGAMIEDDGGLLLYVRDSGIGIPDADLDRVFEPFTQLDNSLARRFQGAGIGLYVARALVLGHGGRLTLTSEVGKGTTAEIRLPATHLM
jgi:signal transduction histidine kinase